MLLQKATSTWKFSEQTIRLWTDWSCFVLWSNISLLKWLSFTSHFRMPPKMAEWSVNPESGGLFVLSVCRVSIKSKRKLALSRLMLKPSLCFYSLIPNIKWMKMYSERAEKRLTLTRISWLSLFLNSLEKKAPKRKVLLGVYFCSNWEGF